MFASLSLHHLSEPQKADAIRLAGRALAPGGALVLVDIFLGAPGEAREAYFERFVADVRGGYELLTDEERDAVLKHGARGRGVSVFVGGVRRGQLRRGRW